MKKSVSHLSVARLRGAAVSLSLLTATILAGCASLPASTAPVAPDAVSLTGGPSRLLLAQSDSPGGNDYVADEVLIQFKAGTSDAAQAAILAGANASLVSELLAKGKRKDKKGNLVHVKVKHGPSVFETIDELRKDAAVDFAEANYIFSHQAVSNDPIYNAVAKATKLPMLWGMLGSVITPKNVYGTGANEAWAANKLGSRSVIVGVIDEGINVTHEDLAANTWLNPRDAANGIDDLTDGNGYKDDLKGWDFANNDNSVYDGGTRGTLDSHGTHVAGTIGAIGGNGRGVAGVNWNVTMISAKFLGAKGGTLANAILAVDYLTDLKTRHGMNIVATNNSWGGGGFSQGLYDAISRANDANILFVAAAGNAGTNNDVTAAYPAGYGNTAVPMPGGLPALPNVISVAAIDRNGNLASFSQYGANAVDIAAPGVDIQSTVAYNTKYASYNGTSMATPHVTGAAALYASIHPTTPDALDPLAAPHTTTAAEIKAAILGAAITTPSLVGKVAAGRRLNVASF